MRDEDPAGGVRVLLVLVLVLVLVLEEKQHATDARNGTEKNEAPRTGRRGDGPSPGLASTARVANPGSTSAGDRRSPLRAIPSETPSKP
jgi:hypothetical protein